MGGSDGLGASRPSNEWEKTEGCGQMGLSPFSGFSLPEPARWLIIPRFLIPPGQAERQISPALLSSKFHSELLTHMPHPVDIWSTLSTCVLCLALPKQPTWLTALVQVLGLESTFTSDG